MQKWEYMVILSHEDDVIETSKKCYAELEWDKMLEMYNVTKLDKDIAIPYLENFLSDLGKEGWEVIAVVSDVNPFQSHYLHPVKLPLRTVLKRPIEN